MKVNVNMTNSETEFSVSSWWAKGPEFVVDALQKQLEAASAIWPELRAYRVAKAGGRKGQVGKAGGEARAAVLTPERRSEIARKAANERWGTTDTRSVT